MLAAFLILMNAKTLPLVYLFGMLFGIAQGGVITFRYIILGTYFGRTNYAQLMGWVHPIGAVFASLAPLLAGYIHDVRGSYTLAFIILIFVVTAGLVCTFFVRPPKPLPSMSAL